MASLEDEQDVAAAKIATAEAGADKAEFDEAAKWEFFNFYFFEQRSFSEPHRSVCWVQLMRQQMRNTSNSSIRLVKLFS